MIERAIRQAIRRLGTRADALGTCPVCGRNVKAGESRVRAWQGKYAHSGCASYRRRHSQRVHDSFTAA
ncbi:MAG: hypothetical protein AABM43_10990 [Actinomycetota bacterium]